jgi:hypothetical protein
MKTTWRLVIALGFLFLLAFGWYALDPPGLAEDPARLDATLDLVLLPVLAVIVCGIVGLLWPEPRD